MNAQRVRWYDQLIGLLIATAYVVLLVKTAHTLGYARDEGFYVQAAESYARWFELLWRDWHAAFQRSAIDAAWGVNHEHPALAKSAFALSWMLLHKKLHLFAQEGTSFRFPGMLAGGVVLWVLYLWGTRAKSRVAGLGAALGFAFMPRVFYHAHLDCFDIPIVAMWLLCAYAYWRSIQGGGWRWVLITGLLFGLALDTKHNSWFLPITFVIHTLVVRISDWRSQYRQGTLSIPASLVSMAIIGPIVFYALWPWIWHDTAGRLEGYVAFHTGHDYYNMEFLGRTYWRPPMPRGYPWVMTLATIPMVTLGCMLVGLAKRAKGLVNIRGVRDDYATRATTILWVLAVVLNYAAWLSPSTPIFGGTKHWMTAYPFLALLAGEGLDWAIDSAKRSGIVVLSHRIAGPVLIGAACLSSPLVQTIRSHPFGLSNYTPLVGGAAGGATIGLNRTFWGFNTGSVTDWLNEKAPKGSGVYIHDTAYQSWDMFVRDARVRKDIHATWSPADGNFGIYHHEPHMEGVEYQYWVAYQTASPAYIPLYDGVPVVWVYARPGIIR